MSHRSWLIHQACLNVLAAELVGDYDIADIRKYALFRFDEEMQRRPGWREWARLDEFIRFVRAEFQTLEAKYAQTVI